MRHPRQDPELQVHGKGGCADQAGWHQGPTCHAHRGAPLLLAMRHPTNCCKNALLRLRVHPMALPALESSCPQA